ncbi:MAG: cellulase family glycosylhydrolase [Candidatus Omnitrophica bacterium]|nr:cellulase family glycosylhydrolase [Candidatus Omnitrophota bacterium]
MILENKSIRGVNLGSWFLMEGYILGGRNIAESEFKDKFRNVYGDKELRKFEKNFRDNFITDIDFKNIAAMGANTVRVPFNHKLFEIKSNVFSENGFKYLEKVFLLAQRYNLGVILDLHAAPGSQNCDWHGDSRGKALLWEDKLCQKHTFELWERIAERFKDEPSLIGYDVLNEPVLGEKNTDVLKGFYKKLIKHIRRVDKKHIIYLEGDIWAQRIEFLKDLIDDKIAISIHYYQPLNYTFNLSPFYRFPGKIDNTSWDKKRIYKSLEGYHEFSIKNKVDIFVGEFGLNWRGGFWGELSWLESVLQVFDEFGFSYTYWTYKAVANNLFPDGLYQYVPNCEYINRQGPTFGWEIYLSLWKKNNKAISEFWKTSNFRPNKEIIGMLSKFFRL